MLLSVILPIRTYSSPNSRLHFMALARRNKAQRSCTFAMLSAAMPDPSHVTPPPPLQVTLTRVGPRELDTDNLPPGLKAIRDGVADWLGTNDGPKAGITWHYDQKAIKATYAVEVCVWR